MNKKTLTRRQELIAVIAISIYLFFIGVNRGGIQLVIADISDLFNIGTEGIGLLAALQQIPPLFMPFLMGMVADKIGKKPVVVGFIAIFAVGCIICGSATGLVMYIIGTLVYKSGSTVSENAATAVLADLDEDKGMQYINLSQFMFSLGAAAGPIALEFCSTHFDTGWNFIFFASTGFFIIMGLVLTMVKFPKNPEKNVTKNADNSVVNTGSKAKTGSRTFIKPIIIILAIAMFCIIGMEMGYGNFIDSFIDHKFSNNSTSALTLSAFWIGMAISRLLFSFVDYNAVRSLKICFASAAIFIALLTFVKNPTSAIIVSGLVGFSYGPTWCTINALAASNSDGNSGTAVGLMAAASGVGGILIPAVMGFIAGKASVTAAIWTLVVIAAIGALVCLTLKSHKEPKVEEYEDGE
ncbi:MAG: MFS transporter [Lachnospiraceae bacterium]|nr:MFS transporter [Lachnospiraceae bacterium]